jgi:histidine triad (HIT) family protein
MAYDSGNIFAKILRGEIPAKKLYEDEHALAIADIAPAAPVHALVMPKGEYVSFDDFVTKAGSDAVAQFFRSVQKAAAQLGVQEGGYRLIANHGGDASQSVAHFHVHILGGRPLGGLVPDDAHSR